MRSDFFQQKPTDVQNASDRLVEKMDVSNMFYDAADGTKVFRVCFDVGQFSPEEIEVKTQDQRLTVHAVHYQKDDDRTVRREFNRQIDIPQNVDPKSLHSTLNKNGVLQVVLCFYRYNCTPVLHLPVDYLSPIKQLRNSTSIYCAVTSVFTFVAMFIYFVIT